MDISEPICRVVKETQTQRTDLWTQWRVGREWDELRE